MGSQAAMGSDRSRTYWTPLMERYFIDLMLEHLHRGNRVGHTFNKQAWTDMLTMFNVKFGCQYDKDILKSRYTNLWKQFNDVKNLLCHIGFSWDAARQMVVADDFVWDAYVKAHPDARSYRAKQMPNFDDLCVIYGYTTADGRYSLSSHDVSFDDELQELKLDDGLGSIAPSSNERPKTDWNADMDQFFIELLLDQVGRGNKVDNALNKKAWSEMLVMFNAKFGSQHGRRVLRHRYKKLWKYYCDIKLLLKQGFSWDENQQMLVADDGVWDAYVRVHPHARTYRLKTLPNYRDLELIFRNGADDEMSNLHLEKDFEDVIPEKKAGQGKGNNPTGTDRTRTYWTPPMDRCLIDLLLEQTTKGNKIGQTFITQAWNEMISSFNMQFKSHYDKEVLKNRYKHLRRQFNDVNNLLKQNDFSWNDKREMVVAEDNIWDAYTKVHPDARSLRVKTLPGYLKLRDIFRKESFEGRYSRLARDEDPGSELPALMTSGEESGSLPSVHDASSTIEWTESIECCFIDLLIDQVNRGNRVGNTFNEQAWNDLIEAFNAKLGLQCDRHFLEDQYSRLTKRHDDISTLLNQGGFAWDETLQMDHPDAISYRNRLLDSYHDLCKIFGNKVDDTRVGVQGQLQWLEANEITIEMDTNEKPENLVVTGNTEIPFQDKNRLTEMLFDSGPPNKKTKIDMRMHEALSEMAGAMKTLVNKEEKNSDNSSENALSVLQAMPDIDDELIIDACDLFEDERKAKTFLALDASLRKKWLLRKLRPL
ncbi:hypothetical protein L6164_015674 [Bauhinia variegata]|uniref:Uncharacterized protein n=1 Tax=Bauhinia variegata TaxID=167791 RepID=A0ACB9NQ21_BAUVA|nr:hypothetical protein L6164_015674 [Bauhinia variegata]